VKPPLVLYCHCTSANLAPADTRRRVIEALAESGAAIETVADLCEGAARKDPILRRVAAAGSVHIYACYPRAVRWLFAAAGAPLAAGATIHNMRTQSADVILSHLAPGDHTVFSHLAPGEYTGGKIPRPASPGRSPAHAFPAKKPGEWVPWFPVIDYDRCKNCRQCLQFCLFGVYAEDAEGKVRVVHPDRCKTGCPACARLCPQTAIIFPKYSEAPIAGDDRLPAKAGAAPPIDFSSLAGLDLKEAMRRREAILRAAHRKGGHE
jgi:Pyruvate/2-oxoacid:ferredoxin oxidoreductase delta subunit